MSATGHESLRLDLDRDALSRFFEALERERRLIGIVGAASRIEPRRRASLVELVLSLNLEPGWRAAQGPGGSAAVMTQMFAPLLAESTKAREALRRALEACPPGAFTPAIPEPRRSHEPAGGVADRNQEPPAPLRRSFRRQAWAGGLAAFVVAVVAVAYLGTQGLGCMFRDQGRCAAPPPVVPGPAPVDTPRNQSKSPQPQPAATPLAEQPGKEVYARFLRAAGRSLTSRTSPLTPRALAQDFAADPAGPPAQQLLEAMFAAVPRDPDLPLPANAEGAADLRRYAAAAAAVAGEKDLEEMLDLATSAHDDEGQNSDQRPLSEVLAEYARQQASSPSSYLGTAASNDSPSRWAPFAAACVALVGVLAAMWRTLRVRDAHLMRALGDLKGEAADVNVQALGIESVDARRFAEIANRMSRRRPAEGRRLDAERTIRASIARLGLFAPIFKPKSAPTDYVFLLKRDARDDHARDRFAAIVDALRLAGARAARYDFSHDPRVLFSEDDWDWRRALPMALLSDRHPDARLILVSDGVELVAPANLHPFAWLRSLKLWRNIGLLTPAVVREEGSAAQSLALSLGWPSNQATLSGLADLVDHFDSWPQRPGAPEAGFAARIERPLPARILNSRTRLLSDAALDPAGQETLIADLRYFLGEHGFYWLAATAIYPELRYEITIFLGRRLNEGADPNRPAVFNEDRLARLASLPWFQVGRFPDWIRWLLFDSIQPVEQRQAQDEVARLLEGARRGDGDSRTKEFDAEVILGGSEPRPTRISLSIWQQESQGVVIPRDSVTMQLLTGGGRTDLLRPVTGHTWEDIKAGARRARWADRAPILVPALTWILAFLWLVPKPWSGPATTGGWLPVLMLSAVAALALIATQRSRLWRAVSAFAAGGTAPRPPASPAAGARTGGARR